MTESPMFAHPFSDSHDTRFHWSAPLVSRSNWSDRRTEFESGSGPLHNTESSTFTGQMSESAKPTQWLTSESTTPIRDRCQSLFYFTEQMSEFTTPTEDKCQSSRHLHTTDVRIHYTYTGQMSESTTHSQDRCQNSLYLQRTDVRVLYTHTGLTSEFILPIQDIRQIPWYLNIFC